MPTDPHAVRATIAALDHVERHILSESATRAIYSKAVRAGDVVLDCGANCGEHTGSLSALVGPQGRVHAFEPNPTHYPVLLAIGPNVRLWPFAVGDALDIRTLHVPEGLDGWASLTDIRGILTDRPFTLASTVQVPPDALRELAGAPIRFIKIDVENNELSALHGMRGLLGANRPPIILENVNPDIIAFLTEAGYEVHDLVGGLVEAGVPMLPNAAALPRDLSPGTVAALLLSDDELRELLDQARAEAAARRAGPAAAPTPEPPPVPPSQPDPAQLELARQAAAMDEMARQATAMEARWQEAEAQLRRLTGSLSWRVTAPLRRVRRWLG